jgi:succinoglycan biosynthesis transport protein ExoP
VATTDNQFRNEPDAVNDTSLRDILDILFRRRRTILAVFLVIVALGVALMFRPRKYTATGTIRIQPGVSSMYRVSPMNMVYGQAEDQIASEVDIIQSRSLYLKVARELNLVDDPAFWGTSKVKTESLSDPKVRERVIRQMKREIKIGHNEKDEIVNITCTTTSPALSAKIVNALINDYVAYLVQMRYGSTQRTSGWLIGQLSDLEQQIEHDQDEITGLQKKLGVIGFDEKNSDYLQTSSLDAMTKAASEATIDRIIAEARLRMLQGSNPNLMEGQVDLPSQQGPGLTSQNMLLQELRSAQATAAADYARLRAQFGDNYPEVQQQKDQLDALNQQIQAEQARIVNQANLSYNAARQDEKMAGGALTHQTGEAFSSRSDMVKYVLLLHDYESHRTLYEGLVQHLREAGITSGLESADVDIVDLADLPALPTPPGPILLLAGSILCGLILGTALALIVDTLDTRVTTKEQAERAARIPLLAVIPHSMSKPGKNNQGTAAAVPLALRGSRFAEAMQSLRSAVLFARPGHPPKTLLVTSAVPNEGKSTTARNLAASFARHGSRVLLVDCDLRKGTQARAFGISALKGVSSILTHQARLESAIEKIPGHENLSLLTAGARPPDPAVLIGSPEMADLIQACTEKFDFIILDSPPVLGLSDTVNLAQIIEGVILIVREGVSNRKAVRNAAAQLSAAHLPVIGFVLNDVDLRAHAYGYGYGYGYGSYYDGYYQETVEQT